MLNEKSSDPFVYTLKDFLLRLVILLVVDGDGSAKDG